MSNIDIEKILFKLDRILSVLESNRASFTDRKTKLQDEPDFKKKPYTKTCDGCQEQIVLKEQDDGKWNAYDNYDTNDFHNCKR